MPTDGTKAAEWLRFFAGVGRFSTYAAAGARVKPAEDAGVPVPEPEDFSETPGRAIRDSVNRRSVLVGRPGSAPLQGSTHRDAGATVAELRRPRGRRPSLFPGDRRAVVERVAGKLGLDGYGAEGLPLDDLAKVTRLMLPGFRVAVVGDGVDDATATSAGDLGIAMGAAASEGAIPSASIALRNSDLRRLPVLAGQSRRARTTIDHNLLIGLASIVDGPAPATLGRGIPVVAAIPPNAGSLIVVFNRARLVRHGEESDTEIQRADSRWTERPPVSAAS